MRLFIAKKMTLATKLLIAFAVAICRIRPIAYGCGVSTHISIAHEASFYMEKSNYKDIIEANQDAFVAGNPYPDFAYAKQCFDAKYHDVSETTHWAPFLNATVNYIRRNYKQPWNEQAQKLIAFTFGFVSHQVADVSWHSLGIDQGFIRAMANVNFHAVFEEAHGTADTGGDMISQLEGDDSRINQFKWFIPSKDLYQIYKEYYGKEMVSQDTIEECTTLLFLAWLGEKIAGAKLFKTYAKKSPFLQEKLHNYFLGGIHDMASWTNEIWQHTETMIEQGTQACHVPRNTLFITCNERNILKNTNGMLLKNPGKTYLRMKHNLTSHDVVKIKQGNGIVLYPNSEVLNLVKNGNEKMVNEITGRYGKRAKDELKFLAALAPYAEAGTSTLYADALPIGPTMLVGAPNYNYEGHAQIGRVFLVNVTEPNGWNDRFFSDGEISSPRDLHDLSYDTLDGPERMSKFGWSMAVVDINKDGLEDLAIGAPSQGASKLQYYGAVYIYFGRKGSKYQKLPDLVFKGNTTFENFGYALSGVDIDNDGFKDLVIGSPFAPTVGPQRGRVDVVIANANKDDIKKVLLATGTQDYEWFGYSLSFTLLKKKPMLLVGAPAYRKCANDDCSYSPQDIQQKGRVFIYDMSLSEPKLVSVIEGPAGFSKFGASLAVGMPFGSASDSMLAVGAPSIDVKGHLIDMVPKTFIQAGSIYVLNLTSVVEQRFSTIFEDLHLNEAVMASFSGDRDYGRFGLAVDFKDTNNDAVDDLIIGSPFRTEDLTEEITGAERGSLYIFNGGKSFPTGDATGDCGSIYVQPCPQLKASRTFHGKEVNARFGSSFVVTKRHHMFVSAPRSSIYGFHSGAVEAINIT